MSKERIGVIVPVYKVEKYIAECIESILAQTYTNFRLILVDDGTPDNAGNICDEYAKKDSRITVIHQENAGVTRARARGVEEADDCEWITFVDGDDTLTADALQCMLKGVNDCTDIVLSNTNKAIGNNGFIQIEIFRKELISEAHCSIWGRLFRKSIIVPSVFCTSKDIYVGEDLLTNLRISFNTQKDVTTIKDRIYNYRYNEDSCINTFVPTLEYEELFHKVLTETLREVSPTGDYTHCHIRRRLLWWDRLFGYSYKRPDWFNSNYHTNLLVDIKSSNFPIGYIEFQLLKTENLMIRFILIWARKIKNKMRL